MKEKFKYLSLTFLRYLGDSFFYPFFSLYLYTKDNIGETKIGILISITPLLGILFNPIFSKICKNFKTLKIVLAIIGTLEALVIAGIVLADTFPLLLVLTILLAIFGSSHYGLSDSLLTIYTKENNMNYANIRVWGSIAYVIGTSVAGVLVEKFNYDFIFYGCAIAFGITSIFYLLVKPVFNETKVEKARDVKAVLNNKGFMLFTISYMILLGLYRTSSNFYPLLLQSRGLGTDVFGYNYTLYVLVEVVLLFIFDKIDKKLNYQILFLIGAISMTLTLGVNATNLPSWVLIAFSMLRGVSNAVTLHLGAKVVVNLLGVNNTTTGSMILYLGTSIVYVICNTIGGAVIEQISYQAYYLMIAILSLVNVIFYFFFVRKRICAHDNSYDLDGKEEAYV